MPIKGKYDGLVANAVTSAEELEIAARSARRKNLDIETVLIDEYHVKPGAIGEALSPVFRRSVRAVQAGPRQAVRAPQEPEPRVPRKQRVGADRRHQGRHGRADDGPGEAPRLARRQQRLPQGKDHYRVCCNHEFTKTLDQMFGADAGRWTGESIGDLLSDMQDDGDEDEALEDMKSPRRPTTRSSSSSTRSSSTPTSRAPPTSTSSRIPARARPRSASARTACCSRTSPSRRLPQRDRGAPQDHVRPRHLRAAQAAGRQDQVQEVRPARHRAARGDHPVAGRRRGHRDAYPGGGEPMPLDKLGCPSTTSSGCKDGDRKPYGLFFVCGPTGSGKTTTLHSVLGYLNTPDTKIWTAEDPVEITQRGLRQVQMNPKAGLDLRRGDAGVPALRSRHHHGRRDAGQGDRGDGHRGLADRPPRVRDAAHEQRAGVDRAAPRHGHGPVQFRRCAARHPGAAPGAAAVQQCKKAHAADARRRSRRCWRNTRTS